MGFAPCPAPLRCRLSSVQGVMVLWMKQTSPKDYFYPTKVKYVLPDVPRCAGGTTVVGAVGVKGVVRMHLLVPRSWAM